MNPFKEALSTQTSNSAFETELSEWVKMGSELKQTYVASLLEILEDGTRVQVSSSSSGVLVEVSTTLTSDERLDFSKLCRNRETTKFIVRRKGKNKFTLVREGVRFVVTSI